MEKENTRKAAVQKQQKAGQDIVKPWQPKPKQPNKPVRKEFQKTPPAAIQQKSAATAKFSPRARSSSTVAALAAAPTPSPCAAPNDGLVALEYLRNGTTWVDATTGTLFFTLGTTVKFRVRKKTSSGSCPVAWTGLIGTVSSDTLEEEVTFSALNSSSTTYQRVNAKCVDYLTSRIVVWEIKFDQTGWKTGYSIPVASSTIARVVSATVKPADCIDRVDPLKTSTPTLIALSGEVRTPATGKIQVNVLGQGSSGTTRNNAIVQAIDKSDGTTVLTTTAGTVVIPTSQTHTVPTLLSFVNTVDPINASRLWSTGGTIVSINVKDQFGDQLDSLYDKTGAAPVVYEVFTNSQSMPPGNSFPTGAIVLPNADFTNGLKLDGVALKLDYFYSRDLTAPEKLQWQQGTFLIPPAAPTQWNNVFALSVPTWTVGLQTIIVHGHTLSNTFLRKIECKPVNWVQNVTIPLALSDIE